MKKILSFMLALGMMLSMMSIVPAQAANVDAGYPYLAYSFDSATDVPTYADKGAYNITWTDKEGVAGSAGSMYFEMTGDSGDAKMTIANPDILMNNKVKISYWVKLDTAKCKVKDSGFRNILWGATEAHTKSYMFRWNGKAEKDVNSGEWTYYEYVIDNWDGYMIDRSPLDKEEPVTLSMRIGGAAFSSSGTKTDALASGTNIAYWLDDFKIEPVGATAASAPTVSEMTVSDALILGQKVDFTYKFTAGNAGTEGATMIRVRKVLANGESTTVSFESVTTKGSYTIELTEDLKDTNIEIDVIPVEQAAGGKVYGAPVTFKAGAVLPEQNVEASLEQTDATTVKASINVTNNVKDTTVKLFMVAVAYDEDGRAARYEVKPLTVATESGTQTFTISVAAKEGFGKITKVKAFVWGGTGVFDTNMKPYTDEPIEIAIS